jgi:hypothetical protein
MSRELPLDSPNWITLADAHRWRLQQVGNRLLADRDLTDAMASGQIASMRRRGVPGKGPDRELLSKSHWFRYRVDTWSDGAFVTPRLRLGALVQFVRGYVFYAWKPDVERAWPLREATIESASPVIEKKEAEKAKRLSRQREIAQSIIDRRYSDGVPETTHTSTVEKEIKADWDAMCRELLTDPDSVRPPSYNTVKDMLGRSEKAD